MPLTLLPASVRLAVDCWPLLVVSTALKALLFPGYFSTDFEVHRNWLAITGNLPPSRWYWDATAATSTLDYPPLFAAFEWGLSQCALAIDPSIIALSPTPLVTPSIVFFQRASVVATEVPLFLALCAFSAATAPRGTCAATSVRRCAMACVLFLLHPGLMVVDSLHFQYNSLILSLLVFSLALAYAGLPLLAVFFLLFLVLTKHLFVVLGPLAAVYCWRAYVAPGYRDAADGGMCCRALWVAGGAASCIAATFAPFLVGSAPMVGAMGAAAPAATGWFPDAGRHAAQIVGRLFPFSRGLVHIYWAPNAWAVYMAADRVFAAIAPRTAGSSSGSLPVADASTAPHQVKLQLLPAVSPAACLALSLAAMVPAVWAAWQRFRVAPVAAAALASGAGAASGKVAPIGAPQQPSPAGLQLHVGAAIAYGCAFVFGWHAHEKAALYVLLPLLLLLPLASAGPPRDEGCEEEGEGGGAGVESGGDGISACARHLVRGGAWWLRLLHAGATVSVMPLIFTAPEQPLVMLWAAAYSVLLWHWTSRVAIGPDAEEEAGVQPTVPSSAGAILYRSLCALCAAVCVAAAVVLQLSYAGASAVLQRLPFLPLMLVSTACAAAVVLGWLSLYADWLLRPQPRAIF